MIFHDFSFVLVHGLLISLPPLMFIGHLKLEIIFVMVEECYWSHSFLDFSMKTKCLGYFETIWDFSELHFFTFTFLPF